MHVYHGQGASRNLHEILDNDLVITTYETLLLKSCILGKILWFRVVLDEGRDLRFGSLKGRYSH